LDDVQVKGELFVKQRVGWLGAMAGVGQMQEFS